MKFKTVLFIAAAFLWAGLMISTAQAGFDGDGINDFFTIRTNGNVEWYVAGPDNTVSSPSTVTASNATAVVVGNFDGDNIADMFVGRDGSGPVSWYKADGTGGIIGVNLNISSHAIKPNGLAFGDYYQDGQNRLFGVNTAGAVLRWRCTGVGSIVYEDVHTTGPVNAVAVADFDGDGNDELFLARDHALHGLKRRADGTTRTMVIDEPDAKAVRFGDFDGDGKNDMFVVRSDGTIRWYKPTGVDAPPVVVATFSSDAVSCSLADLDGNGTVSLIISRGSGHVHWYEFDHDLGQPVQVTSDGIWGGHYDIAAVGFQRYNVDLPAVVWRKVVRQYEADPEGEPLGHNDLHFPCIAVFEEAPSRQMMNWTMGQHGLGSQSQERGVHIVSDNGGQTWYGGNFVMGVMTNLKLPGIGPRITVGFPTYEVTSQQRQGVIGYRWADSMMLQTHQTTVQFPFDVDGANFHGGLIILDDGTLLATSPTRRAGSDYLEVSIMESSDYGFTWTYRSTAAQHESWMGDEGPNESDLVKMRDGRLLCVSRTGAMGPNYPDPEAVPLIYMFSDDDGLTWTAPLSLGVPGVDPELVELDNGLIALAYGRPGDHLKFFDPATDTWSETFTVDNTAGCGYTSIVKDLDGDLLVAYTESDFHDRSVWYRDNPKDYNYLWLAKVAVEQPCGGKGYPEADLNFDCVVDLLDFAVLASNWLDSKL